MELFISQIDIINAHTYNVRFNVFFFKNSSFCIQNVRGGVLYIIIVKFCLFFHKFFVLNFLHGDRLTINQYSRTGRNYGYVDIYRYIGRGTSISRGIRTYMRRDCPKSFGALKFDEQ